ncbi:hypothetical protein ONZ45_g9954 [Pleurotus djamor]|nr:hypothetical protein ONZ45_g9954 [Pleurotus djamor]
MTKHITCRLTDASVAEISRTSTWSSTTISSSTYLPIRRTVEHRMDEISLRHLPDVSDDSFSIQLPSTSSGSDSRTFLLEEGDDFLAQAGDVTFGLLNDTTMDGVDSRMASPMKSRRKTTRFLPPLFTQARKDAAIASHPRQPSHQPYDDRVESHTNPNHIRRTNDIHASSSASASDPSSSSSRQARPTSSQTRHIPALRGHDAIPDDDEDNEDVSLDLTAVLSSTPLFHEKLPISKERNSKEREHEKEVDVVDSLPKTKTNVKMGVEMKTTVNMKKYGIEMKTDLLARIPGKRGPPAAPAAAGGVTLKHADPADEHDDEDASHAGGGVGASSGRRTRIFQKPPRALPHDGGRSADVDEPKPSKLKVQEVGEGPSKRWRTRSAEEGGLNAPASTSATMTITASSTKATTATTTAVAIKNIFAAALHDDSDLPSHAPPAPPALAPTSNGRDEPSPSSTPKPTRPTAFHTASHMANGHEHEHEQLTRMEDVDISFVSPQAGGLAARLLMYGATGSSIAHGTGASGIGGGVATTSVAGTVGPSKLAGAPRAVGGGGGNQDRKEPSQTKKKPTPPILPPPPPPPQQSQKEQKEQKEQSRRPVAHKPKVSSSRVQPTTTATTTTNTTAGQVKTSQSQKQSSNASTSASVSVSTSSSSSSGTTHTREPSSKIRTEKRPSSTGLLPSSEATSKMITNTTINQAKTRSMIKVDATDVKSKPSSSATSTMSSSKPTTTARPSARSSARAPPAKVAGGITEFVGEGEEEEDVRMDVEEDAVGGGGDMDVVDEAAEQEYEEEEEEDVPTPRPRRTPSPSHQPHYRETLLPHVPDEHLYVPDEGMEENVDGGGEEEEEDDDEEDDPAGPLRLSSLSPRKLTQPQHTQSQSAFSHGLSPPPHFAFDSSLTTSPEASSSTDPPHTREEEPTRTTSRKRSSCDGQGSSATSAGSGCGGGSGGRGEGTERVRKKMKVDVSEPVKGKGKTTKTSTSTLKSSSSTSTSNSRTQPHPEAKGKAKALAARIVLGGSAGTRPARARVASGSTKPSSSSTGPSSSTGAAASGSSSTRPSASTSALRTSVPKTHPKPMSKPKTQLKPTSKDDPSTSQRRRSRSSLSASAKAAALGSSSGLGVGGRGGEKARLSWVGKAKAKEKRLSVSVSASTSTTTRARVVPPPWNDDTSTSNNPRTNASRLHMPTGTRTRTAEGSAAEIPRGSVGTRISEEEEDMGEDDMFSGGVRVHHLDQEHRQEWQVNQHEPAREDEGDDDHRIGCMGGSVRGEEDGMKTVGVLMLDASNQHPTRPMGTSRSSTSMSSSSNHNTHSRSSSGLSNSKSSSTSARPHPTIPLPFTFHTTQRASSRSVFDAHLKQKEAERQREEEERERERREEEEREVREIRKRSVPVVHGVPGWYRDAPRREGKENKDKS